MNYPKVGIGVLIFKGQKLLLGERKTPHGAHTWGPPGGHLEFGESFEECAIRETHEETGLKITSPTFIAVTNDIFSAEKHYVSIFLSSWYEGDQLIRNMEPEKVSTWEWININALPDNLFLPLKNLIAERGSEFIDGLGQEMV